MKSLGPRNQNRFRKRLDRWVSELNIVLLVLAVGLAILDGSCYIALNITHGRVPLATTPE